jgi:hypothetical protein
MGSAKSGLCPQNMPLIPPPLRKIMFELNRWLANSPTHINKYFSGLEEVLIRHEGLYIGKNYFSPQLTTPLSMYIGQIIILEPVLSFGIIL